MSMRDFIGSPVIRWVALLLLCAAYLQGGFDKAMDFGSAIAEMEHFGLSPPRLFAVATIVLEFGASLLILSGFYRWLGALVLAVFTVMATFMAARFWELPPPQRIASANTFFEHLGLAGGFLLTAWHDLRERRAVPT
jgi:uncharacterized membrane protein YphA (DoxX/SURF4 family)